MKKFYSSNFFFSNWNRAQFFQIYKTLKKNYTLCWIKELLMCDVLIHALCNVYIGMNISTFQNMDYFLQVTHSKSFHLKAWSVKFLTIQTTLLNSGKSEQQPKITSQSQQGNSPSLIGRDRHVLCFIPNKVNTAHWVFWFLFCFVVFWYSWHRISVALTRCQLLLASHHA